MRKRRIWGAALAATTVLVLTGVGASSSEGADSGPPVVAGTWNVRLTVPPSKPPEFSTTSGTSTYYFGSGCALGKSCSISRSTGVGPYSATPLVPHKGGLTWTTTQRYACQDKFTGQVSVEYGADYHATGALRPSRFTVQHGVRYATALRGTLVETITTNAAGRAVNCRASNGTFSITMRSRLAGSMVPLAVSPTTTSQVPLAVDKTRTMSGGTIRQFVLPQSDEERLSAEAVAAGRRSSFPAALTTPADAVKSIGGRAGKVLLLAAMLGLLMVFPAQLFNSTYEENHERIDAVLGRVRRRRTPAVPAGAPSRGLRLAVFFGCAAAGTLLGGLLDPGFGLNTPSAALVVGVFFSLLVTTAIGGLSGRAFRWFTHRPAAWYLRAVPSALLVGVVCVVVSRLTHFAPGYLYGVIGGAVFAAVLGDKGSEGRAEVAAFGGALLVALAAWIVFEPVAHAANGADPGFLVLSLDSFLAALFVGGVEGLVLGMVPLRFLPGHRVRGWSWILWGVLTASVLVLFVHVLLLPESGYLGRSTTASVTVTIGLLVTFALVSVLFWLYFRLRPDDAPHDIAPEPVIADPAPMPAAPGPMPAAPGPMPAAPGPTS